MNLPPLTYPIALTMVPGIGDINAKKLIAYCGSAEAVFKEKRSALLKIPGIGEVLSKELIESKVFKEVEKELEFIEKYQIKVYYYQDTTYPERLKQCEDGPIVFYMKGNTDLDHTKMLSIVGTRSPTTFGKEITEKIVAELSSRHNLTIVSGMAYGIDITAQKASFRAGIQTIGVLAHGLHTIYPTAHANFAEKFISQGALITEFKSTENPERPFFVKRNRIIAGLTDATLVVESKENGGALLTAEFANSYNREVFAIPGKPSDIYSKGCNNLIKSNKAALVESAEDIEILLGWDIKSKVIQKQLFNEISPDEEIIIKILKQENELGIDIISFRADLPVSKVSTLLLNLEFSGIVKSMPGKIYKLL